MDSHLKYEMPGCPADLEGISTGYIYKISYKFPKIVDYIVIAIPQRHH